jgi:hypothetical protein
MRIRAMVALVGVLGCLFSTSAFAVESYLCIGEQATGFIFNETNKTWSTSKLTTRKWIIKKSETPSSKWVVLMFGTDSPVAYCKEDFNENGSMVCDGFFDFRMNNIKLRFISAYLIGYWGIHAEGEDSPSIEIGKCSRI